MSAWEKFAEIEKKAVSVGLQSYEYGKYVLLYETIEPRETELKEKRGYIICPICKKEFFPTHGSQKYCSKKCERRYAREREWKRRAEKRRNKG